MSFPRLQYFTTINYSKNEVWDFAKHEPPLRELRLLADGTRDIVIPVSPPFLTHLEIGANISVSTFLEVFKSFPALSHFKFCFHDWEEYSIIAPTTPAVFPHLSSLVLGSGASASALHLVTLPYLHFLDLASFSPVEPVRELFTRSACAIDHVVISFQGCDDEDDEGDIAEWLELFPTVSVLEVTECHGLDVLLECFDSPPLLPRLTDVTIRSSVNLANIDNNYDDDLLEMLHNRRSPDDVRLGLDRVWCLGYLAKSALTALMAEGLDFVLCLNHNERAQFWPKTYIEEDTGPDFP
ncbi:hypothetical protein C8R45DRAFT_1150316 [Mycena sanguinolenta]|nr:hypothetical protein C8R45DRAFT_1150316 [Mycena sanguinolenta]